MSKCGHPTSSSTKYVNSGDYPSEPEYANPFIIIGTTVVVAPFAYAIGYIVPYSLFMILTVGQGSVAKLEWVSQIIAMLIGGSVLLGGIWFAFDQWKQMGTKKVAEEVLGFLFLLACIVLAIFLAVVFLKYLTT